MCKVIGIKSMRSFICRNVLYIVLYFYTTLESVIFSVFCDLVPVASRILKFYRPESPEGQLVYKVIGLRSMYRFICRE